MLLQRFLLSGLVVSPALGRTLHSVLVFSRHGDRTAKYFENYQMTNLGAAQCFDSGSYYRQRYIVNGSPDQIADISSEAADFNQLWASAPDQSVLYQTALDFMQGLYPPLGSIDEGVASETLSNGTSITAPLNGYQYIHIQGEGDTDPDTIWLKGDDQCPAWEDASETYAESEQYASTLGSTNEFYSTFVPLLGDIMGIENINYAEAYDVFDLLNVAYIHNASISDQIDPADLNQLRYLANEWEWNHNFNSTQPDRSIGGMALAGGILRQLEEVVSQDATLKFNLMTGSYDTFLAFFGLANLSAVDNDFMGLPNYASTMAFELFSEADNASFPTDPEQDLRIRFLFRNGTAGDEELTAYPLFGLSENALSYGDFVARMNEFAIASVSEWCRSCRAEADFCAAETASSETDVPENGGTNTGPTLSNAAAGGIGAAVTIVVIGIVGLLAWILLRRKKRSNSVIQPPTAEKRLSDSGSGSNAA